MGIVDSSVQPDEIRQEPRNELSRAHHAACGARYAHRHGPGGQAHRGAGSAHGRRHSVSSRHLNSAAVRQQPAPAPHPDRHAVITCVAVTVAVGLLYIIAAGVFWSEMNREFFWAGLLLIVVGGAVCENAIRVDSVRRPAGLSSTDRVPQH